MYSKTCIHPLHSSVFCRWITYLYVHTCIHSSALPSDQFISGVKPPITVHLYTSIYSQVHPFTGVRTLSFSTLLQNHLVILLHSPTHQYGCWLVSHQSFLRFWHDRFLNFLRFIYLFLKNTHYRSLLVSLPTQSPTYPPLFLPSVCIALLNLKIKQQRCLPSTCLAIIHLITPCVPSCCFIFIFLCLSESL